MRRTQETWDWKHILPSMIYQSSANSDTLRWVWVTGPTFIECCRILMCNQHVEMQLGTMCMPPSRCNQGYCVIQYDSTLLFDTEPDCPYQHNGAAHLDFSQFHVQLMCNILLCTFLKSRFAADPGFQQVGGVTLRCHRVKVKKWSKIYLIYLNAVSSDEFGSATQPLYLH